MNIRSYSKMNAVFTLTNWHCSCMHLLSGDKVSAEARRYFMDISSHPSWKRGIQWLCLPELQFMEMRWGDGDFLILSISSGLRLQKFLVTRGPTTDAFPSITLLQRSLPTSLTVATIMCNRFSISPIPLPLSHCKTQRTKLCQGKSNSPSTLVMLTL